ncbi:hypothetical protein GCM10020255_043950 [Rhodococcus baikonurensis]
MARYSGFRGVKRYPEGGEYVLHTPPQQGDAVLLFAVLCNRRCDVAVPESDAVPGSGLSQL